MNNNQVNINNQEVKKPEVILIPSNNSNNCDKPRILGLNSNLNQLRSKLNEIRNKNLESKRMNQML